MQCLILVKYGVPWDIAFSLHDAERFAYVVIYKQMYENLIFDFRSKRWRERPPPKQLGGGRG